MIFETIGLAGLALSLLSFGAAAVNLSRQRRTRPPRADGGFAPAVSIVKPLSGLDDDLAANLATFYRLDYPDFEIVYSFASEKDPAFPIARRVADANPGVRSVFVVDPSEPGLNAKVNRLEAGARRARNPLLLFSDGNVRVRPDFLLRAASEFASPAVGLVSNPFCAAGAVTIASRIETLHLNGFLQAGTALLAGPLGRTCVVGKSILVSRDALAAIGGLASLRDVLAEDFLLGEAVSRAGYAVRLSSDEVETAEVCKSARAVWSRHRRWAILRARLGGAGYAAEALASPALWFVLTVAAAPLEPVVLALACALWAGRIAVEAALAHQAGRRFRISDGLLALPRDLALAALFWAGLFGRRTRWRGRALVVGRRSLLRPVGANPRRVEPLFTPASYGLPTIGS